MRQDRILIFILLLLTLGFRIIDLKADPPANFDWSGGYFADDGFWSHNARNEILFGKAVLDEWDARIVSPIFSTIQIAVFHLLGPGLVSVRLIGILSSILIALVTFLLVRKEHPPEKAFLISALISLSYPMLVLGRQGILDPFVAMLAWSAFFCLYHGKRVSSFLAGVLLVACCATKYLMVYILVPLGIALYDQNPHSRSQKAGLIAGVLVSLSLWLALNYFPNQELLNAYSRFYASQQSWEPVQLARNIVEQPFYLYFVKTPAILCFGNLLLFLFLSRPRESRGLEKICWIWLISGIAFFALWKYRPLRYYTSLMLPLGALAGFFFFRIHDFHQVARTRRGILLWLGMLIPFVQILFVCLDRWFGWNVIPAQVGIQISDAMLFLLLTVCTALLIVLNKPAMWFAAAFCIVFLLSDMKNYLSWMLRPEYAAINISHDLQRRVNSGVLTGQWAPELCLENRVRTLPIWRGFVNSNSSLAELGITHILQWHYAIGGEKFQEWYPAEFGNYHPVAHYRIKDSDLILYERKK